MYKAIHQETNTEIIILDPTWEDKIKSLRKWDREGLLVCQECQQPVRTRAGQVRTWHFAHKHRQDCPIGYESPQLLQARAMLYQWLLSKFEPERVTLEKRIEGAGLPRPVDCWVQQGERNLAYWILDAGLTPQRRDALHLAMARQDVAVCWIFSVAMLQQDEDNPNAIHLTTTERDFMQTSEYDRPVRPNGQTLHYLDHETGQVVTYRGLYLRHAPQVYQGKRLAHSMDQMLVSPKTGEFVHPGEHDSLEAYRKEQEEQEKIASRFVRPAPTPTPTPTQRPIYEQQSLFAPPPAPAQQQPSPPSLPDTADSTPPSQGSGASAPPIGKEMGICEFCGQETNDWWWYKAGKCRCQECRRKGTNTGDG